MKPINSLQLIFIFMVTFFLTSCDAILSIFEAGMWVGVIIVILIIGLIVWLIGSLRK